MSPQLAIKSIPCYSLLGLALTAFSAVGKIRICIIFLCASEKIGTKLTSRTKSEGVGLVGGAHVA